MIVRQTIWLILAVCLISSFAGCRISDEEAEVSQIRPLDTKYKDFILLGNTEYQPELTLALSKYGFNLKPFAVQQKVKELERHDRLVEYNEAETQYAIELNIRYIGAACVFSNNYTIDVTMSIIDIHDNNTLMVIKQCGPNGECPPLTPVWELLAAELAKSWGIESRDEAGEGKPVAILH